jgi:hypothetical protein
MTRTRSLQFVLALIALGTVCLNPASVASQTVEGEIYGRLLQGTVGGPTVDAVTLQLITLDSHGVNEAVETVSKGTAFRFKVVPRAENTYFIRATYEDVSYMSPPILLSSELPTAELEITVFETTTVQPKLRIDSTIATVLVLDRTNAQLTIERVDEVINPSDRVYVGNRDGVTLRLPLPNGVVEATGVGPEGKFAQVGATMTVSIPLRPGIASVVTRYVVGYDRVSDTYTLRVTTPFSTQRMEIEVPIRFSDHLQPLSQSIRADKREVSGERVEVIEREGTARPGDSVSVRLEGLSGLNAENPLTSTAGAFVAVLVAIAVVSSGALLLVRTRSKDDSTLGDSA